MTPPLTSHNAKEVRVEIWDAIWQTKEDPLLFSILTWIIFLDLAEKVAEFEKAKGERTALDKEIVDKKAALTKLDADIEAKKGDVAELEQKAKALE